MVEIMRKDDEDKKLNRISFMSNDQPYQSLLQQDGIHRGSRQGSFISALTVMSVQSEDYGSIATKGADDLGGHETKLLEMVRARNRELVEEHQDKTLVLPRDETDEEDTVSDGCAHGLSMRITERSISRSRVSRMSTRRDMDIPSILAFTTNVAPSRMHMGIPAFQKKSTPQREELPRFSIRRALCPVCSQKWKDRSSIRNVKSSGLKRSTAAELPSVIAPARLRTSITLGYVPRPTLAAVDEEVGLAPGGFRNSRTSTAWQLTRARRYRLPKPQMPIAEAVAPTTSAAPLRRKDLDQRVSRFLNDTTIKKSANVI